MAPPPSPGRAERLPLRLAIVPVASVVAASFLSLLPVSGNVPLVPPLGLLVLVGWRLLRPELWEPWIALPLGLIDDLVGGAPLGSAMVVWTVVLLGLDIADHRLVWRDYWTDWGLAALASAVGIVAAWAIARFAGGSGPLWIVAAQLLLAILVFPAVARLCRGLDRWRLRAGVIVSR